MKRTNFLVMLVIALVLPLVFNSCSKDDEVNNSIVGTWKFKEAVAGEVKTNSAANDAKITDYIVNEAKYDADGILTFRADDTYQAAYDDGTDIVEGTYTFSNGILSRKVGSETWSEKASVENGILTIEEDYIAGVQWQIAHNPEFLSHIGIDDEDFVITKATVKTIFSRQ